MITTGFWFTNACWWYSYLDGLLLLEDVGFMVTIYYKTVYFMEAFKGLRGKKPKNQFGQGRGELPLLARWGRGLPLHGTNFIYKHLI